MVVQPPENQVTKAVEADDEGVNVDLVSLLRNYGYAFRIGMGYTKK
jgi:hypothetical protein